MHLTQERGRYLSKNWNGLSVFYTKDLADGGLEFADDFLKMLTGLSFKPPCGRILEWNCGPGFIGYALMAYGFGTSLCLIDSRDPAIEMAEYTAKANDVDRLVSLYRGEGISALPKGEQFDLVVAHPPYFPNRVMLEVIHANDSKANPQLYVDPDWRLHKQFFSSIGRYLKPNGRIILLECTNASHFETFRPMIEAENLVVSGWQWSCTRGSDMWYLFVSRNDATEPFCIE